MPTLRRTPHPCSSHCCPLASGNLKSQDLKKMYENKPPRHCDKRSKARGSINHPCQKLSVSRLKALNPKSKDQSQSEKIEIFMLRCKIAQLPKISLKIRGLWHLCTALRGRRGWSLTRLWRRGWRPWIPGFQRQDIHPM